MDRNKRLAEALGICWHECVEWKSFNNGLSFQPVCRCGYHSPHDLDFDEHCKKGNPNFTADPTLVLVEMRKRKDWFLFLRFLYVDAAMPEEILDRSLVQLILDRTGKLAEMAIEWMERRKK